MKDEIQFLVDDLEEQNRKELERLLKVMEHPLMERDTYVLWKFTRALMKAVREKKWLEENPKTDEVKITSEEQHTVEVEHDGISIVNEDGNKDLSLKFSKDETNGLFIPEMPDAPMPGTFGKQEDIKIANTQKYAIVFDRETNKGLVYAEIYGNNYRLIEPNITPRDEELIRNVAKKYGNKLNKLAFERDKLSEIIEKAAKKEGIRFDNIYFVNMRYYLMRDSLFSGKVEAFMHDEKISRIICDGINKNIRVDYNGILLETNMQYDNPEEIIFRIDDTDNDKNVIIMNVEGTWRLYHYENKILRYNYDLK